MNRHDSIEMIEATGSDVPRRSGRVRKRYVVLILFLLFVVWMGWKVVGAVTAKPGSLVDYGQQLLDTAANMQPEGENGWPILAEALQEFAEIGLPALPDWPTDPSISQNIRGLGRISEGAYDPARLKFELAYLDYIRKSGVLERLDDFAAHPRCAREAWQADGGEGLLFILLPELSQSRLLARARVADMRVAAQTGDTAELVRAWLHAISLGRAMSFDPTLISHLVGIAIDSLACAELNQILTESELDEATCRQLLAVLDERPALAPMSAVFERERLAKYDLIQRTYSDDGHGDGILLFDRFQELTAYAGGGPVLTGNHPLYNVAGLVFPGRAETLRSVDEYFDAMEARAELPRDERANYPVDPDVLVESLPRLQLFLRLMLPALGRAAANDDMIHATIDGTRVLLAIEMYQSHYGRLPSVLEDLAPEFLPTLPEDASSCRSFVYVIREPDADDSRPFWLYSIGADEADNGGVEAKDSNHGVVLSGSPDGKGFDYIFNRLRDPYSDKPVDSEMDSELDSRGTNPDAEQVPEDVGGG